MDNQHREPPSRTQRLKPLPKPVRPEPLKRNRRSNTPEPAPIPRPKPIDPDDFELPERSAPRPVNRRAEPTLLEAFQVFARRMHRKIMSAVPSNPYPDRPADGDRRGRHSSADTKPVRRPARSRTSSGAGNHSRRRGRIQYTRVAGAAALSLVCISLLVLIIWSAVNKNAYAVMIGEQVVGNIIKANDIDEAVIQSQAVKYLESSLGANVHVNETVTIKPVHASAKNISAYDDIISMIGRDYFTYKIAACAIYVDGSEIAVLKTQAEATAIVDYLSAPYLKDNVKYVDISFVEDWQTMTKLVEEHELDTVDDALILLDKKVRTTNDYVIQSGDFLGTIAVRFNTTVSKICEDNPGYTESTVLKPGNILKLETSGPYLSVKTVEEIVRKESVAMPVENRDNPNEIKTYTKVVQEGRDGEEEITVRITRINGIQSGEEEVISRRRSLEPVTRIVETGTLDAAAQRR